MKRNPEAMADQALKEVERSISTFLKGRRKAVTKAAKALIATGETNATIKGRLKDAIAKAILKSFDMKKYITVSNPDFYALLQSGDPQYLKDWTISPHVRSGYGVALYIARVSAIVAIATVIDDPVRKSVNDDRYYSNVDELQFLREPLQRIELLQLYPTWGYWKQPRQNLQVPSTLEQHFWALLESRIY